VTLEALLVGVASYAGGERVDLDALSRALDDRARRVALVAKPLVGPLGRGSASRRTRRRLGLYVAAVAQARALVLSLQRRAVARPDTVVAAARALADAVRALLSADIGEGAPHAGEPLWRSDVALFGDHESARDGDPVVRHLHHLGATLTELAETGLGVAAP
jgi:hypothetical protein